jgi:hypothetical protein
MAFHESLVIEILQQVASDYNLNFKEVKSRYFIEKPEAVSLSKMKKTDLVIECRYYGLDEDGSVSQLKERVKKSRSESGIKTVRGNKKRKIMKKTPIVHNHPICEEIVEGCELCKSHGNVMCLVKVEYEIV